MMSYHIKIYLGNFNVCIAKEDCFLYIYLHTGHVFGSIKIHESNPVYMLDNNYVGVEIRGEDVTSQQDITIIEENVLDFLKQLHSYKNFKIKLAGKGYKLKKTSKNSANLMFNRAHITYVWWNNLNSKKIRKYKLYLYGLKNSLKSNRNIISVRFVNIFTKRGLRISRQLLYKKKGKK